MKTRKPAALVNNMSNVSNVNNKNNHEQQETMPPELVRAWKGRRYNAFSRYLRDTFDQPVGKIAIESGLSCPNRDGTVGHGGCSYCNPAAFAANTGPALRSVTRQIQEARDHLLSRYKFRKFLAYFQTYTNTHAPVEELESMFREALAHPDIAGLAVSTRPDCLPDPVLELLAELNRETHLWVEVGLQSAHDSTLQRINRGHDLAVFIDACERLQARNIRICTHVILGLPGENLEMMLETARLLNRLHVAGLKMHQLQIVRDTAMAGDLAEGSIGTPSLETYLDWAQAFLGTIDPDIVIHRLFGISRSASVLAPRWDISKQALQQRLEKELEENNVWQGKYTHIRGRQT